MEVLTVVLFRRYIPPRTLCIELVHAGCEHTSDIDVLTTDEKLDFSEATISSSQTRLCMCQACLECGFVKQEWKYFVMHFMTGIGKAE